MKISIIVTTYNRENFLKETIKSILDQTYVDFELIVIDNNSNYDFFKLIDSFCDDRILAYQNENRGIIAINRNFGIKKAKGQYIAFCDDDDIWEKNKLELQIKEIKKAKNKKCIVYSNTTLFGDNIDKNITKKKKIRKIDDFFNTNYITFSTVMLKKTDIVFFDEDPIKIAAEDFDLWLKLLFDKYDFIFIPKPLIKYRVISNSAFRKDYNLSYLRFLYVLYGNIIRFKIYDFNYLKLLISSIKHLLKYFSRRLIK